MTKKRAAVIGYPVSHSLSPRLHGYWLEQYGIKGSYDALLVTPEALENFLKNLPEKGFAGVNLTLPHKEAALRLVDTADETAKRIGAVNMIVVEGKKLVGANTDAYGFIENLKSVIPVRPPGKALVLGAGGAARAVCAGLLQEKWHIALAGRTRKKAEAIAEKIGTDSVEVVEWERLQDAMQDAALLVNTTPLGMTGQAPLVIPLSALPLSAQVCDIVYHPLMTPLLKQAKARGHPIITGLGMLLYQAQPAFEAWFGVRPDVTLDLRRYMEEALA